MRTFRLVLCCSSLHQGDILIWFGFALISWADGLIRFFNGSRQNSGELMHNLIREQDVYITIYSEGTRFRAFLTWCQIRRGLSTLVWGLWWDGGTQYILHNWIKECWIRKHTLHELSDVEGVVHWLVLICVLRGLLLHSLNCDVGLFGLRLLPRLKLNSARCMRQRKYT